MGRLAHDLRSGFRQLRLHPGFSVVALFCLALGIGACTAVFVVGDGLLNGPFRIPDRDRIVALHPMQESGQFARSSYPDFEDIRDGCRDVAELYSRIYFPVSFSAAGSAQVLLADLVSDEYFGTLRVTAQVGRTFAPGEASRGSRRSLAVISDHLWREALQGDPGVTGRVIRVNRQPFEVIGVAPPGFRGELAGFATDVWLPITAVESVLPASVPLTERRFGFLDIAGRLKGGVTLEQARQKLTSVHAEIDRAHPRDDGRRKYVMLDGIQSRLPEPNMARGVGLLLSVLAALVVFVLLMAGANVTSLLIVRCEERRHELAARRALGASPGRILAQLLTESLPLALAGAAAGLLVARLLLDLFTSPDVPSPVPVEVVLAIGWRAAAVATGIAVFCAAAASVLPALRANSVATSEALKDGRGTVVGGHRARLQTVLVGIQVAVCLALVTASGLTLRSLAWVMTVDPGFNTQNLLTVHMDLKYVLYEPEEGRKFQKELLRRVEGLPDVRSASISVTTPLSFMKQSSLVESGGGVRVTSNFNSVMPHYFETMGIPILRGRGIEEQDTYRSEKVVVVNESLAKRLWGGRDPVGLTMRVDGELRRVVGVARDSKYFYIGEAQEDHFYFPLTQNYAPFIALFVRVKADPMLALERVKSVIEGLEPALPVTEARTMREQMTLTEYPMRITSLMVGSFAMMALLMALAGLAGLVAQTATQRTREFGLRIALGASRAHILRQVLWRAGSVCGLGALLGLPLSLALSKGLSGLLLGVSARDPLVFAATPVVVLCLAIGACYLPAWRASRSDPAETLRYE